MPTASPSPSSTAATTSRAPRAPNHWTSFTESKVDAQEAFEGHFMADFMAGKFKPEAPKGQLNIAPKKGKQTSLIPSEPMQFSAVAQAVFTAGRALWRYYHAQPAANPNASCYDIRDAHRALGDKIAPKVYEYGFLKE